MGLNFIKCLSRSISSIPKMAERFWLIATLSVIAGACSNPTPTSSPTTSTNVEGVSTATSQAKDFTVGMVLVGPKQDGGWNQAHFEGTQEALKATPGVKFEYVDKVNPADRPNIKGSQVADELIANGAKLVIFNSDDFKDDALETAKKQTRQ